jgi:hypothetical protein
MQLRSMTEEMLKSQPPAAPERKPRGDPAGRPPDYDWKKIGILTAVSVHADGVPQGKGRLTKFRDQLETAMGNDHWLDEDIPGKTMMQNYVRAFYQAFDKAMR